MNFISRNMNWLSRLGAKDQWALGALLDSPLIVEALDQVEQNDLAERRALIAKLETAPARHDKACIEAQRAYDAAKAAVKEAEERFKAAQAKEREAFAHSMGLSMLKTHEIATLTNQLEESADPRIDSVQRALRNYFQDIRHFTSVNLEERKRHAAGLEALSAAHAAMANLRLQALSRTEVTAAIEEIADRVRAAFGGTVRILDLTAALSE